MSRQEKVFTETHNRSEFRITHGEHHPDWKAMRDRRLIHLIWNRSTQPQSLLVDNQPIVLSPASVLSLTYLHQIELTSPGDELIIISFNREFYCIKDHDQEVSCNGLIFFGAQDTPLITLSPEEQQKFELLYQVFEDEFGTRDHIQGEMLRILLKRFIIKTTRLARDQVLKPGTDHSHVETIRQFNLLVDMHFRTRKQVSDYAELLHKSPKTLANLFSKHQQPSPLSIIHNRISLEAKRQLLFTEASIKEIAYDLGFDEVTHFTRFFKKKTGESPAFFRKNHQESSKEE